MYLLTGSALILATKSSIPAATAAWCRHDSFKDGSAVWSTYIQEQEEEVLQTALKKLQQQQAAAAASAGSK